MNCALPPQTPDQWFDHLFTAKSARAGSVVRRKVRDMERWVGRDAFLAETRTRAIQYASMPQVWCSGLR